MRPTILLVLLLCCGGCGGQVDSKLDELGAKPAASTVQEAKALYDEVNDLIKWHNDPSNTPMTPEQKTRAQELLQKRLGQMAKLSGNAIIGGISNALGVVGLAGEAKDWVIGIDNPEVDKFKGPPRSPTDKRGAKGWP